MTSDPIGNTRRRSPWTGNGWRQSTGSGWVERAAIYRTRPKIVEPCRQLEPLPAIVAREPRRRTAPGLESRADVDPFQRVRGRLASCRGRREGANKPGRNGIFRLQFSASPSRPLWPCILVLGLQLIEGVSHDRQISSTCSGGLFLTVLSAFQRGGSKPEIVIGGGSTRRTQAITPGMLTRPGPTRPRPRSRHNPSRPRPRLRHETLTDAWWPSSPRVT